MVGTRDAGCMVRRKWKMGRGNRDVGGGGGGGKQGTLCLIAQLCKFWLLKVNLVAGRRKSDYSRSANNWRVNDKAAPSIRVGEVSNSPRASSLPPSPLPLVHFLHILSFPTSKGISLLPPAAAYIHYRQQL